MDDPQKSEQKEQIQFRLQQFVDNLKNRNPRTLVIAGILALAIVAIPVSLVLVQSSTDSRQHASELKRKGRGNHGKGPKDFRGVDRQQNSLQSSDSDVNAVLQILDQDNKDDDVTSDEHAEEKDIDSALNDVDSVSKNAPQTQ